jgi:hypothetical protein
MSSSGSEQTADGLVTVTESEPVASISLSKKNFFVAIDK